METIEVWSSEDEAETKAKNEIGAKQTRRKPEQNQEVETEREPRGGQY